jgi:hypothetical protein
MKRVIALLSILPLCGQRLPDGQPDFQGVWTSATITPFERPLELADKPFLTEAEAAEAERRAAQSRVDAPPPPGNVGTYNQVWFDSGTRVAATRQSSLVVDPPNGRVPVLASAEARRDYDLAHVADSWEHMSVWDRCITRGVPGGMFPAGYNNAYQIVQTADHFVIFAEMIHEARVIPVGTRQHLPPAVRQWNGDSVAWWEGETLVIDTTNFNGLGWITTSAATGRIKGIPQSRSLHLVERLRRADANTLLYEVTVEDPEVYSRPWKALVPLVGDEGYQIYEYACHEGNQAVANILSGGRAAESR